MLRESAQTREPESQLPSARIGSTKPLPSQIRVNDSNPSCLPDATFLALRRFREAEAKLIVRLTSGQIEQGLLARLKWPTK